MIIKEDYGTLTGGELEVESIITDVQKSLTAGKNYATGKTFIYDGKMYKATSDIAAGSAIVLSGSGANATPAGDVMAQMSMMYKEVLVESKYKEYSPEKTFSADSGEIIIETINVSKTGYIPIGVVGIYFWGSSNQQMVIDTFRITGNGNAEIAYRHIPGTQYCVVSRIYVEVLYKKN